MVIDAFYIEKNAGLRNIRKNIKSEKGISPLIVNPCMGIGHTAIFMGIHPYLWAYSHIYGHKMVIGASLP